MSELLMQRVVQGIQQIVQGILAAASKNAGIKLRCVKLANRLDDLRQDLEYLKQHDNEDIRRCFRQLHQFTEEVTKYIKKLNSERGAKTGPWKMANHLAQADRVDDDLKELEEELNYIMMRVTLLISRNTNQMVRRRGRKRHEAVCDSGEEPISMLSMATTESSMSDEDKVRLLEMQVKVCMEDFQQERSDREKAQGTIDTLQREIQQLKRQMESERRQRSLESERVQNSRLLNSGKGPQAEPVDGSSQSQLDRILMLETLINIRTAEHEQEKALLEAQLQTCMEDFHTERQERVKAEQTARDLEDELDLVKRQLEQFQVNHMEDLANRRMAALAMHQNKYNQAHPNVNRFAVMADGDIEEDGLEDDTAGGDCIDSFGNDLNMATSFPQARGSANESSIRDGTKTGNDETLYCPKCDLPYPTSRHSDLVDHVMECCK